MTRNLYRNKNNEFVTYAALYYENHGQEMENFKTKGKPKVFTPSIEEKATMEKLTKFYFTRPAKKSKEENLESSDSD